MRKLLVLYLLFILLPVYAQDATFEPTRCQFILPAGLSPECGYLVVPENRADPDGNTIRLAVAIFRSENPSPDPLIYLSDGPGDETLSQLHWDFPFAPYLDTHDVILFDPRGVGYSQPTLFCEDYLRAYEQSLALTTDDTAALEAGLQTCRDRFTADGIDLTAYTTDALAADVNDLRLALGYDTVNLIGKGYGAHLAQIVAQTYPETVRSIILGEQAGEGIDISETASQLDAVPLRLIAGDNLTVLLNGERFRRLLSWMEEHTELVPAIPVVIEEVKNGNTATVQRLITLMLQAEDARSHGLYFAVQPPETLPSTDTPTLTIDGGDALFAGECPAGIIRAFLQNPAETPDTSCLASLTETNGNLIMIPFHSEAINMSSTAPVGWIEEQPGVFYRSPDSYDTLIFSQQPFSTVDEALAVVQEQLTLTTPPEQVDAISANGLNWRLYQIELPEDGITLDLAAAEVEGLVYFVNLVSDTANGERYHTEIFIPAVERTTIP